MCVSFIGLTHKLLHASLQAKEVSWGLAAEGTFLARKHLSASSQHKASTSARSIASSWKCFLQPACDRRSQRQLARSWQVRQQSPYHLSALLAFCTLCLPGIFIEHRHWGIRSLVVLTRHVAQGTQSQQERFSRKTHADFRLSLVPR